MAPALPLTGLHVAPLPEVWRQPPLAGGGAATGGGGLMIAAVYLPLIFLSGFAVGCLVFLAGWWLWHRL